MGVGLGVVFGLAPRLGVFLPYFFPISSLFLPYISRISPPESRCPCAWRRAACGGTGCLARARARVRVRVRVRIRARTGVGFGVRVGLTVKVGGRVGVVQVTELAQHEEAYRDGQRGLRRRVKRSGYDKG